MVVEPLGSTRKEFMMAKKIRQLAKPDGTVWSLPAGTLNKAEGQLYKALSKHGSGIMRRIADDDDFCITVARFLQSIYPYPHIIDCSAEPSIPRGLISVSIGKHCKGPIAAVEHMGEGLYLDGRRVELYLSQEQKKGRSEGFLLRKELMQKPVLNVNVLDYLLKHLELIPEEWKEKDEGNNTQYFYFWGTIYNPGACTFVRFLFWDGAKWCQSYKHIEGTSWYSNDIALLAA